MNSLSGSFSPSKKPQKKVVVDNPIEALKDVGGNIVQTATESSAQAVKDMWSQILGVEKYAQSTPKQSGVLEKGKPQEIKPKEHTQKSEAPMSYFREIQEAGKHTAAIESHEIRQQVQSIMYELSRLASVSKTVEKEVAAGIGTGIVNPGKYHVAFFEWMLIVVKDARKRVENASAWLHTVSKKKGFIQGMKKNMSQMMSGERSVSNQVG